MNEVSQGLYGRALDVLPGGVNSPVRAFGAVGGIPTFIESAEGARFVDADRREYVDLIGSWGAMIAGHAHPVVVEAIIDAARSGTSFGTCCEREIQLAEAITNRVASVKKVRMVNSGTEAVQSALRLARAATGRAGIIKFDGCYHGHVDPLLVKAGSGAATLGLPDSPGIPASVTADTITARYNDAREVATIFEKHADRIAAVIVEPVAGNMGVVPPVAGFLESLRDCCTQFGALLIFDEVMTGFRVHPHGAQGMFNGTPDLTTFGKIIGGGLPVGAYGGREDLMNLVAPAGPVYQAGTLAGNPLAMAAGLATISLLDESSYERLERISAAIEFEVDAAFKHVGLDAVIQRVGSMLTIFFRRDPVRNFDDAGEADHAMFGKFFRHMLESGVHLPPSGYEACFVSLAHDTADVKKIVSAVREFRP